MFRCLNRDPRPGSLALGAAALACLLLGASAHAGPFTVAVSEARNDAGKVRCGLFNRADGWRQEELALRAIEAPIQSGRAICDFGQVPEGEYAVAVFHAEHGEDKIQYGFLGKPKQGVGFSNNPSITFGAPDFQTALISVGNGSQTISVVLRY